jgi:hypothetical protein
MKVQIQNGFGNIFCILRVLLIFNYREFVLATLKHVYRYIKSVNTTVYKLLIPIVNITDYQKQN